MRNQILNIQYIVDKSKSKPKRQHFEIEAVIFDVTKSCRDLSYAIDKFRQVREKKTTVYKNK